MYIKYEDPSIPEIFLSFDGCEECTKEFNSIQNQYTISVIRPIKSCNVNIRQKPSLNQTRVKGVFEVGLQKTSAK